MDRAKLRTILRNEFLDDYKEPYLWSDDTLNDLINESKNEVAIRSRLFQSTRNVPFTAGTAVVVMDADIIEVSRVKQAGKRPLDRTSIEEMDDRSDSWDTRTGTPQDYLGTSILLGGDGKLQVVPIPTEDVTYAVTSYITPPDMTSDATESSIPNNRQWDSLHWAAHLAYSRRDSDAEDSARAAKHEAQFEAAFGYRFDANAERKRAEHRPRRVRMNQDWR